MGQVLTQNGKGLAQAVVLLCFTIGFTAARRKVFFAAVNDSQRDIASLNAVALLLFDGLFVLSFYVTAG